MNFKRVKTTVAAGVLAASMLLPNVTAYAATLSDPNSYLKDNTTNVITKIVESPDGVTYDRTFTYTFEQEKSRKSDSNVDANQKDAAIKSVTIEAKGDKADYKDQTNKTGDKTESLNLTEALDLSSIVDAGVYTYKVTETQLTADEKSADAQKGETWTYDSTAYRLRVYATWVKDANGNNTTTLDKKITLVKMDAEGNDTGDKQSTATFTNTLTKESSFKLTKEITDTNGLESSDALYEFTVTIAPSTLGTSDSVAYTYSVEGDSTKQNVKFVSGGKIQLKSGQTATFSGVPAGSLVKVEESKDIANVNYDETAITVKDSSEAANGTTNKVTTVENVLVKEGNVTSISYNNTWKTLTVTGVVTDVAPYVTLVVVAVAAVAAYVVFKRRVAR